MAGWVEVRASDVDKIWALAPPGSRRRSKKAKVASTLGAALHRAAERGDGDIIPQVLAALREYFASSDAELCGGGMGVHKMIMGDRWQDYGEAMGLFSIRPGVAPCSRPALSKSNTARRHMHVISDNPGAQDGQ